MFLTMVKATAKAGSCGELQRVLEAVCHKTRGWLGHDLYQNPVDQNSITFVMRWSGQNSLDRSGHGIAVMELMQALTPFCDRAEIELHTPHDSARNGTATTSKATKLASIGLPASRRFLTGPNAIELRKPVLGEEAIVRSLESYIRRHLDENLSVGELAAVAGVSARTLFRTFRTHRGRSPMKVLEAARLEQVRHRLLQGGRADTVTRVASDSGFTHLGRFSGLYKRAYGETPSETLRRSRKRSSLVVSSELGRRAS